MVWGAQSYTSLSVLTLSRLSKEGCGQSCLREKPLTCNETWLRIVLGICCIPKTSNTITLVRVLSTVTCVLLSSMRLSIISQKDPTQTKSAGFIASDFFFFIPSLFLLSYLFSSLAGFRITLLRFPNDMPIQNGILHNTNTLLHLDRDIELLLNAEPSTFHKQQNHFLLIYIIYKTQKKTEASCFSFFLSFPPTKKILILRIFVAPRFFLFFNAHTLRQRSQRPGPRADR